MSDEELRRSESRFRALAEGSPAGIFIVEGRRLTYVNPALVSITERSREQLLGSDPLELLHPSDRTAAETRRAARERGELDLERHELRIRTPGGQERWLDLTTSPIIYEGRAALLGTGIDITERRRLEDGLRDRQQFEALGRLAGGVAHDFNNLLLVIGGEVERLIEGLPPGDPLRASADAVARAAGRAAELTGHLLAFGRRQTLTALSVDVRAVVAGLERALRDGPAHVHPRLQMSEHLPLVRVDRQRLEQVILSLYANASDAMHERGEVLITADVTSVDAAMRRGRAWLPPGGSWVRLRIADSGPGIPADVLPRVFEPFFTTKRGGASTGLGLSTVYGIVKQSAGYVWIDSLPGSGACVTVLLPPDQDAPARPGRSAVAAPARARVLLVDDQDGVRDLLTTVLQRDGFEVIGAESAERALELASAATFDVLLSDVVLPGMPGPDLARRLRLQAPHLHVLFMSGYTGDALDTAEFGGESAFIQKPFASKALIARLRSFLEAEIGEAGPSPPAHSR